MINENKKVRNATTTTYKGISFKSKLELMAFKTLEENGIIANYEPLKYHIWQGFKPTAPFYIKDKKTKSLKLDTTKIMDITYTPDLAFNYNGYLVLIEIKPDYCNDVYPYKRKLFRKYLEESKENVIFAQIGTKKNLIEFINILKTNYSQSYEES